jgi:hypothetical protein
MDWSSSMMDSGQCLSVQYLKISLKYTKKIKFKLNLVKFSKLRNSKNVIFFYFFKNLKFKLKNKFLKYLKQFW